MNRMLKWAQLMRTCQLRWRELNTMNSLPVIQEGLIYHCLLSKTKRRNLALQQINRSVLKRFEPAYPHILHIGVTTRCNLRCPACPTGTTALGRPGEHLDFDLYCQTVDTLRDYLMFMLFWDWGEPLLHPRLPEMIAHAGKSHIKTVISTNGNIPNSPDRMERLVSAKPSTIIVCVDGADQQTYQSYRVGGHLKTVLQTIRHLANAREKLKQPYPLIEFRSLATNLTERQMPQLLKLARESGADLFSVKTLRPYNYRGSDIDETMTPEDVRLSRYLYEDNKRGAAHRKDFLSKGPLRCAKPLYAPTLNADGRLAFCSYAQDEKEFFGCLAEHGVDTVWKRADSRTRRIDFLQAGGTRACRTCFFRSDHSPTIVHQVPLRPIPDGIDVQTPLSFQAFLDVAACNEPLEKTSAAKAAPEREHLLSDKTPKRQPGEGSHYSQWGDRA